MKHTRLLGTAAIVATAATVLLTSGVAHAAPAVSLHLSAHAANTRSPGQAGYEVASGATGSASAKWTVPAVTCHSTSDGMAPGTFLFENNGAPVGVTVIIDCSSGSPTYSAYFIAPSGVTASSVVVSPGDKLVSSITQSASATSESLKDTTTKKLQSVSDVGATSQLSFIGVDSLVSGGVVRPVPTFTTVPFSSALMNGATPASAGATALDLSITPPTINIKTSGLNTAGNKFKEIFKAN